MKFFQIITTTDKRESAERIAKALLEKRLAGCVQIWGPISSSYWWENKIEKADEYIIFIKTRGELYKAVEKTIKELHPYDVPEIIALPILMGYAEYLEWLFNETRTPDNSESGL